MSGFVSTYDCSLPKNSDCIYIESDKKGDSILSGVLNCNSIYQCNTCATRILPRRELELESINKQHLLSGGCVYFISLPVNSKKKSDSFESLLGFKFSKKGILGAYNYFISKNENFKNIVQKYNIQMSCSYFECDWGKDNGFTVTLNLLYYMKKKLTVEELDLFKKEFYILWSNSLKRSNFRVPNIENTLYIQDFINVKSYIQTFFLSVKLENNNYTIPYLNELLIDKKQKEIPINQLLNVLKEYFKSSYDKKFLDWDDKYELRKKYLNLDKLEEQYENEILETTEFPIKEKISIDSMSYIKFLSLNQEHELLTAIELYSFKGLLSLSKKLYISTKDIHFIYDLTITEENKINKINNFKNEFNFSSAAFSPGS